MERVFRSSIRRFKRLVLEPKFYCHAKRRRTFAYVLPRYPNREFGEAMALSHLASENGANGM
jgi:hypothetical protein